MLTTLSDSILAVVYPQECSICRMLVESASDGIACSDCWNTTKIFNGCETLCTKCGAFLFEGARNAPVSCGKCEDHSYDNAYSAGVYGKALATSIVYLKTTPHISRRLRRLLEAVVDHIPTDATSVIIPVPLSPRRRRERGFNQAEVIATIAAKYARLPLDQNSLIRNVHTPMHRAGMDRKARKVTVERAFSVVRPKLVEDRHIVLVDDVFTTGATVSACASVLKKSGATRVDVLTVAHAA